MRLKLITGPTEEPVTLAEAKAHLRIEHNDLDSLITAQITSARLQVESITARALITQTWEQTWDWGFPCTITLDKNPVQSITSVTYIDTAGVTQTVGVSDYTYDLNAPRALIYPAYGMYWPTARGERNAVTVRFVAGFGAASAVPEDIKTAIKLMLDTVISDISEFTRNSYQRAIDLHLSPHRLPTLGG